MRRPLEENPDADPAPRVAAAAKEHDRPGRLPTWAIAVIATMAVQTAAAFMIRIIPTLGPAFAKRGDFSEAMVGHLSAAHTAGSILFLVIGAPLMKRFGPLRSLQIGIGLAALGALILALPPMAISVLACLLIGLGYGPSAPAGTDILHKFAPAKHRALIFSVKQAGVPLGGVMAGLILPPLAAIDLLLALAVAAAIVLALAFAVQPARRVTDGERDLGQAVDARAFLSLANLTTPLRAVWQSADLPRLAFAGACFATAQGSILAFQVTYLVSVAGLSLTLAGALSALMHVVGIFGRVLLGWVSDRIGSGLITMRYLSLASAATLAAYAATGAATPIWLHAALAGIAGVTVMSWNGIILSEMAKLAHPGQIAAMASGATMLTFLGYVVGPSGFALLLWLSGDWRLCFGVVALVVAGASLLVTGRTPAKGAAA